MIKEVWSREPQQTVNNIRYLTCGKKVLNPIKPDKVNTHIYSMYICNYTTHTCHMVQDFFSCDIMYTVTYRPAALEDVTNINCIACREKLFNAIYKYMRAFGTFHCLCIM